jgi:hypothetical protein
MFNEDFTDFQVVSDNIARIQYRCSSGLFDHGMLSTLKEVTESLDKAWNSLEDHSLDFVKIECFPATPFSSYVNEYSTEKSYVGAFTRFVFQCLPNQKTSYLLNRFNKREEHRGTGIFVEISWDKSQSNRSNILSDHSNRKTDLGQIIDCFKKYINLSTVNITLDQVLSEKIITKVSFWCDWE